MVQDVQVGISPLKYTKDILWMVGITLHRLFFVVFPSHVFSWKKSIQGAAAFLPSKVIFIGDLYNIYIGSKMF
jgi:hypothetical protein